MDRDIVTGYKTTQLLPTVHALACMKALSMSSGRELPALEFDQHICQVFIFVNFLCGRLTETPERK
jgi:hypothetical protein